MNYIILLYLFLTFLNSSCASIERDIYFRNKDSKVSWVTAEARPGIKYVSDKILIGNDGGGVSVYTNVINRVEGSYLWGFILPVIPVFFLPQFKFQFNNGERIKINCGVGYSVGKQYLKKDPSHDDWYFLNEDGVRLMKQRATIGSDKCTSLKIILPDGKIVNPLSISVSPSGGGVDFEFPLFIEQVKEFSYEITEIQLNTGQKKSVNIHVPVILEDFTRYYMAPVAP